MLTTIQYVKQWKQWINRDKKYSPDELEELETFLLDKIEDLQETQKLSDKEAFLKALDIMGEQGMLTEEFSKVRRSKFDKVKLWAYGQTFIILGLVMVIAAPYVHLSKKHPSDSLISNKIGEIDKRVKNYPIFKVNSYVTYKNETYFVDEYINTLFSYKYNSPDFSRYLSFYLDTTEFEGEIFDIDSKNNLYKKQFLDGYIDIFQSKQWIKTISYNDKIDPSSITDTIKVIERNLVILITQKQNLFVTLNDRETAVSYSPEKAVSYLLVYHLDTNQWDRINLENSALSMDRSEDEIAILLENGNILILTTQKNKLVEKESWKIKDFSLYLYIKGRPETILNKLKLLWRKLLSKKYAVRKIGHSAVTVKGPFISPRTIDKSISLLYSKKNHQAVLISYQQTRYSFLSPNTKKEYSVIPLLDKDIEGIIKINYREEERVVLVRDDEVDSYSRIFNMYLFKE